MQHNINTNKNLSATLEILQNFLTEEEFNVLLESGDQSPLSTINSATLGKYLKKQTVHNVLQGKTYFFNLATQAFDGCFELFLSDRLMSIVNSRYAKKTNFMIPASVTIGEYNISFMTDEEYRDGLVLYLGEVCGDCGSLGKPGGMYVLADLLSASSRSLLVRKNGEIIGSSMVYFNDRDNALVISSLNCLSKQNTSIIRLLVENMSLELLRNNQDIDQVVIGIGGSSFRHIDGVKFERAASGVQTEEYRALGRIRHHSDLNLFFAELKICESAIGYPILRAMNRISTDMEQLGFNQEEFKDCLHVASIISRDTLIARADEIKEKTSSLTRSIHSKQERLLFQKFMASMKRKTPSLFLRALLIKTTDNYITSQSLERYPQKAKNPSNPYLIYIAGFRMWGAVDEQADRLQAICDEAINEGEFAEVVTVERCRKRSTSSVGYIAQSDTKQNPIMIYMQLRFFPLSTDRVMTQFRVSMASPKI